MYQSGEKGDGLGDVLTNEVWWVQIGPANPSPVVIDFDTTIDATHSFAGQRVDVCDGPGGPVHVQVAAGGVVGHLSVHGSSEVTISGGDVTDGVKVGGTAIIELQTDLTLAGDLVLDDGAEYVSALGKEAGGQVLAAGRVTVGADARLTLQVSGDDPFRAGQYTLIHAQGGLHGRFDTESDLGEYVGDDSVQYTTTMLTVTIGHDLNSGDANLDTKTNVLDFNEWNAHKFTEGTKWASGDFNGDGKTNVLDFNVWNEAKFTSAAEPGALVEGQVPEPSTPILLLAALTFATVYYRRRHRSA
jgi:hypothetical protein